MYPNLCKDCPSMPTHSKKYKNKNKKQMEIHLEIQTLHTDYKDIVKCIEYRNIVEKCTK